MAFGSPWRLNSDPSARKEHMSTHSDLLSRTRPLSDPVRVMTILMVVSGAVLAAIKIATAMIVTALALHREQAMAAQHLSADAVRAMGAMAASVAAVGVLMV